MISSSAESIAVIGRGIVGLSAAYRLSEAGFKVSVFGRKEAESTASKSAQGVLCNKGLIFHEAPLFGAKLRSLAHMKTLLPKLEQESGLPIPRLFQGVEEPYWSPDDFNAMLNRVYRRNFWGCYRAQNRFGPPAWAEEDAKPLGSVYYPDDAWFDVQVLLEALELILRRRGAAFHEDRLLDIRRSPDGPLALSFAAAPQVMSFDRVVLATGAGSLEIWGKCGLPKLKVFAIGGQSFRLPYSTQSHDRIIVKGTLSLALKSGKAFLGSSSWKGFERPDGDAEQLIEQAQKQFGLSFSLSDAQISQGIRLRFADRMPIVGFAPDPAWNRRLYISTGYYKNGVHLADICAQDLVFDMLGMTDSRAYPAFSFARFSV